MRITAYLLCIILVAINLNSFSQPKGNSTETNIIIKTDSGEIKILLYSETPLHKENFLKLIEDGYYDGMIFHRLIKNFMIQGGDPNSKNAVKGEMLGQGGPGYTIPSEINPKYYHKKGALAAARKGDQVNPSRSSSGSQFYIIQGSVFTKEQLKFMEESHKHASFTPKEIEDYTQSGGSPHLDGAYTVFGEVTEGLSVLEGLMKSPVDAYDRPINDIHFTITIAK